jgi:hypothetical protein
VPTPGLLATRPPTPVQPDGEDGLDALLALFGTDEAPAAGPAVRPSLRAAAVRLLAWLRGSSRRAAAWGAVAEPSGRAW